jgi:1-deoxy-D-xylulose-5-phosphate reductoisomerase
MEKEKKNIAILGSTGSIGTQTIDVIKRNPNAFNVEVLTAENNWKLLIEQAKELKPNAVVIANTRHFKTVNDALFDEGIKVFAGEEALEQVVEMESIHMVLVALVGFSGLKPTLNAINHNKPIALANKETLVVGGELITKTAKEKAVNIYPVDSEHSAIFQCLNGEFHNPVEKIYLTASGGPFRGYSKKQLEKVSKKEALNHPTWNMGCKVTIDSATLMNKGLEVIEAKWLFGLKPEQIDVIIHPQSIIHSFVQFEDGSMKTQMGLPDMRLPIQYALSYPERYKTKFERFNFLDYPNLTFETPDIDNFRNLALAYKALEKEGNVPCVLNAANEIAVKAFLKDEISFLQIPEVIEHCMEEIRFIRHPGLDDLFETDREARILADELIKL